MSPSLTAFSGINMIALTAATGVLAVWAYRQFGITSLLWMVVTKITSALAGLASARYLQPDFESIKQRAESHLDPNPLDTFLTLSVAPHGLILISPLLILLIVAADLRHHGPKLNPTFQPKPLLLLAHRHRLSIGLLAILFTAAPSLLTISLVKSITP